MPPASRSSRNLTCLAGGSRPASAAPAASAPGPLTRITAIAAGGLPLESAKIVSEGMAQALSACPRPCECSGKQAADADFRVDPAVIDHLAGDPDDNDDSDVADPAVTADVASDEI